MATSAKPSSLQRVAAVFRDVRVLQGIAQVVFVLLVVLAARWLIGNLLESIETRGLSLSFEFLRRTAGFMIGEGLPMERTNSFFYAYIVGLVNSLRVILVGLVLATVVGIFPELAAAIDRFGVCRDHAQHALACSALLPLFRRHPAPAFPARPPRPGAFQPEQPRFLLPAPCAPAWLFLLAGKSDGRIGFDRILLKRRLLHGVETRPGLWAALLIFGLPSAGWLLSPGRPLLLENPVLIGLRMEGGARLSPEFAGILLGLVLYTAAFIADIVRAGILAVPKGQTEAARSIGLTGFQVTRFVVLPQAMRVIVPPLTNQYLNLAKNSSLAVGVGYPDLYNVSSTIFNQSGQAVQVISLMMVTYLVMSLSISVIMNFINDRLKIPER